MTFKCAKDTTIYNLRAGGQVGGKDNLVCFILAFGFTTCGGHGRYSFGRTGALRDVIGLRSLPSGSGFETLILRTLLGKSSTVALEGPVGSSCCKGGLETSSKAGSVFENTETTRFVNGFRDVVDIPETALGGADAT